MNAHVKIIEATGFSLQDTNFGPDTFCIVQVTGAEKIQKTFLYENSISPKWNQDFCFSFDLSGLKTLTILIKIDDNGEADIPLSIVEIPLNEFEDNCTIDKWFKMCPVYEVKNEIQIHLRLLLTLQTISQDKLEQLMQQFQEGYKKERFNTIAKNRFFSDFTEQPKYAKPTEGPPVPLLLPQVFDIQLPMNKKRSSKGSEASKKRQPKNTNGQQDSNNPKQTKSKKKMQDIKPVPPQINVTPTLSPSQGKITQQIFGNSQIDTPIQGQAQKLFIQNVQTQPPQFSQMQQFQAQQMPQMNQIPVKQKNSIPTQQPPTYLPQQMPPINQFTMQPMNQTPGYGFQQTPLPVQKINMHPPPQMPNQSGQQIQELHGQMMPQQMMPQQIKKPLNQQTQQIGKVSGQLIQQLHSRTQMPINPNQNMTLMQQNTMYQMNPPFQNPHLHYMQPPNNKNMVYSMGSPQMISSHPQQIPPHGFSGNPIRFNSQINQFQNQTSNPQK